MMNQVKSIIVVFLILLLFMFSTHCTWVTSNAYSSPSVVLASQNPDGSRNILDDFREAYYWLSYGSKIFCLKLKRAFTLTK